MKKIINNEKEIWRVHPDIVGIEVSSLGRVRSLKGCCYGINPGKNGYMRVCFRVNGKVVNKLVHRLVAQTFLPNPDNLPEVNHKDCNPQNNSVSNLEWCTTSYNRQYREKYGISQLESQGQPLFAVNLSTLEVSHFRAQREASRALGVNVGNINSVIKGKYKSTGGYWFVNDDENTDDAIKHKLQEIEKV